MFIQRDLFPGIKEHLTEKEITLIVGPRQAGKTTIMEMLRDDLVKQGRQTVFLNMDFESDRPFFASQERLLARIAYSVGKQEGYVFLDEIQRKENAGIFLKGIYDMNLPYKFIVSGSGSLELKEKIHESLAGRKRIFELSTLSFEEFVRFKTGSDAPIAQFFDLYPQRGIQYLEDYLNFGGYPRVVLADTAEQKYAAMTDIYQSFMEKDIAILLNIKKTEYLSQLLRIMASQIGGLVNISELSNTLGVSKQTVKEYLWYLEKTYILRVVTPYFRNVRKEITKAPTYYFVDTGLGNYAHQQFGNATASPSGFLFQNFVFRRLSDLVHNSPATIHFWRTRDGAEMDFVVHGREPIPVEVKYLRLTKPEVSRSYRSFLAKYMPGNGYIVHLGNRMEARIGKTTVHFLPFYDSSLLRL